MVKPKMAFRSIGYGGVPLDPSKTYRGVIASNQPNYIEEGKVFVTARGKGGTWDEYLLTKDDYDMVKRGWHNESGRHREASFKGKRKKMRKPIQVEVISKRRDVNGNTVYTVFINGHNDKIYGLRKLKGYGLYSLQSYGGTLLREKLEYFLNAKIKLNTI